MRHFIAEVLEILPDDYYKITYYKKASQPKKFVKSETEIYDIPTSDIIRKLPMPECEGGSERQISLISFNVDFETYNLG